MSDDVMLVVAVTAVLLAIAMSYPAFSILWPEL
jgi:hypothetical protein